MKALLAVSIMALDLCFAFGQGQPAGSGLRIVKLEAPIYPKIARAAHISGTVVVNLTLGEDGTPVRATVESGPPMLSPAALESAKKARFEPPQADGRVHAFGLTYKFMLDDPKGCDQDPSYPRVQVESNIVQVTEQAFLTCDPAGHVTSLRYRSARCLFLWRCGSKVIEQD